GEYHQRAIQQAPLFEIKNELRNRLVDGLLHSFAVRMAILVSITAQERNVLGRDFDEARTRLREPPGQKAAETKSAGVVFFIVLLWLHRPIKRLSHVRC